MVRWGDTGLLRRRFLAQKSSLRERVKEGVEEEEAEEEEEEVKESLDADRVGRRNWGCRREEGVMELLLCEEEGRGRGGHGGGGKRRK